MEGGYQQRTPEGSLEGVEVVIDKDKASALLARQLGARLLILATDADGVYRDWGTGKPGIDTGHHTRRDRRWILSLDPWAES